MYSKLQNKGNLSHNVANQIKYLIQNEKYKPHDKLPNEIQLAELFGVSRPTIREAIKILASQNIIEIIRGRGTFVSKNPGISKDPLGLEFLVDENLPLSLIEARQIIEPSVAQFAAEHASKEDIERLETIIGEMKQMLNKHVPWVEIELEFHRSVAQATQNPIIMRIVPIIQEAIIKTFQYASPDSFNHKQAILEHFEIFSGIKNKDPQKAYDAMHRHLENSYSRTIIIGSIKEHKK